MLLLTKTETNDKQHVWNRQCILERSTDSLLSPEHQSRSAERVLLVISLLTVLFVLIEMIGGYLANSLAIMTDAFHMLSDLSSFIVSILAIHLSRRAATTKYNFGFQRAEVLGALSSILVIWVLTGVLLYLAVWRIIQHEYSVEPDTMMVTAGIGVLFNLLIGLMLHWVSSRAGGQVLSAHGHSHHNQHGAAEEKEMENGSIGSMVDTNIVGSTSSFASSSSCPGAGAHQNLNIRAAFIHVFGDLVQSLGVLIAAVIIKCTGFELADPICTLLFSVLVLFTTIPVFGDTLTILMEASPRHINHQKLFLDLMSLNSVVGVHSLRVWALKTDTFAATVHLELADESIQVDKVVALAQRKLALGHRIRFTTIQTHCALDTTMASDGNEKEAAKIFTEGIDAKVMMGAQKHDDKQQHHQTTVGKSNGIINSAAVGEGTTDEEEEMEEMDNNNDNRERK